MLGGWGKAGEDIRELEDICDPPSGSMIHPSYNCIKTLPNNIELDTNGWRWSCSTTAGVGQAWTLQFCCSWLVTPWRLQQLYFAPLAWNSTSSMVFRRVLLLSEQMSTPLRLQHYCTPVQYLQFTTPQVWPQCFYLLIPYLFSLPCLPLTN